MSAENLTDEQHSASAEVAGPSNIFHVKNSLINLINNDNTPEELRDLSISIYKQEDFEQGVIAQVDQAIAAEERRYRRQKATKKIDTLNKEIELVKTELRRKEKQLESVANGPGNSQKIDTNLQKINDEIASKKKRLTVLARKVDNCTFKIESDTESNDSDTFPNGKALNILSRNQESNETDRDRMIRLGEMTPFGTCVNAASMARPAARRSSASYRVEAEPMTDFEMFLQDEESRITKQRSIVAVPRVPEKPKERKRVEVETEFEKYLKDQEEDRLDKTMQKKKKKKNDLQVKSTEQSHCIVEEDSPVPQRSDDLKRRRDSESTESHPKKSRGRKSSDRSNNDEDPDYAPSSPMNGRVSDDEFSVEEKRAGLPQIKKYIDDGDESAYHKRIKHGKAVEEFRRLEGEVDSDPEDHEFDGGLVVPGKIWKNLFGYQRTGVKWFYELHQQQCGGILGDEMGLGKTIQVIAFLAALKKSKLRDPGMKYLGLGPVLILCPTTVMHQWVKEFHAWYPPFRVAILHETGTYVGSRERLISSIANSNSILITSYSSIVLCQDILLKHEWHYIIIDEGHKIRNPDAQITLASKQFRTSHRIILSGSPLQNNLKELWSLFDFIFPGKLGTLPAFMQSFSVPITQGGYANATDVQVKTAYRCACILRDTIGPYLLRRLKADVQSSIKLPEKNEHVLFCRLSEEQLQIYKEYISSRDCQAILAGNAQIFPGLITLRKICNHPDIASGGPVLLKGEEPASDEQRFGYYKRSGKMIVIEALLRLWKKQKHRVLLFSQSRVMLDILESFAASRGYTYLRMDGQTSISGRQPLISQFNSDPSIYIFLLTTKVGGLGVNLTGANRVIIYDPDWNPSTDVQARERAWRIGQKNQVTVYRLITSGSIEEKIYHRQIFKQFLTNRVLKDPKQRRFFKYNDLHELFTLGDPQVEQSGGTETSAIFAGTGSRIKVKRKKHTKHKKGAKFEGHRIAHLERMGAYDRSQTEEQAKVNDDDYVLRKLFKKSRVHEALKHDTIVDAGNPDFALVEGEAERVAKEAVKALKASRRYCMPASSGIPTWTGHSGTLNRPLFGRKSSSLLSTSSEMNADGDKEELPSSRFNGANDPLGLKPPSSSLLLARMRARNIEPQGNDDDEDVAPDAREEDVDLLQEIRDFIRIGSKMGAKQASSEELAERFKSKLPPDRSVFFKKMLQSLCNFSRNPSGIGVWRLKEEFQ